MKKIGIYVMSLFLTVSMSTFAQQNRSGNKGNKKHYSERPYKEKVNKKNAKERAAWLAEELNLTEKQKAELEVHFKKNEKQRAEHQARQKAERQKMRDERKKVREQHRAELENIIDKDNMKKLDQIRKKRQNAMKGK